MISPTFMSVFKKTFIFTAGAWILAFVFAAAAGESPKATLAKVQERVNTPLVRQTETIEAKDLQEVVIKSVSDRIRVGVSASNQIELSYEGSSEEAKPVKVNRSGSTLELVIDKKSREFNLTFVEDKAAKGLELLLPKDYHGSLTVKTASGDLRLQDLELAKLSVASVSGEVEIKRISAEASVRTTSGDVEIEQLKGSVDIATVSGDVELEGVTGSVVRSKSVSGDLEISNADTEEIHAKAVSGDVALQLKEPKTWLIETKSMSGDIKNEVGSNESAKKKIRVATTSGDIRIR